MEFLTMDKTRQNARKFKTSSAKFISCTNFVDIVSMRVPRILPILQICFAYFMRQKVVF